MKHFKKIVALAIAFVCLVSIGFAMPKATNEFYVNDFANIFITAKICGLRVGNGF